MQLYDNLRKWKRSWTHEPCGNVGRLACAYLLYPFIQQQHQQHTTSLSKTLLDNTNNPAQQNNDKPARQKQATQINGARRAKGQPTPPQATARQTKPGEIMRFWQPFSSQENPRQRMFKPAKMGRIDGQDSAPGMDRPYECWGNPFTNWCRMFVQPQYEVEWLCLSNEGSTPTMAWTTQRSKVYQTPWTTQQVLPFLFIQDKDPDLGGGGGGETTRTQTRRAMGTRSSSVPVFSLGGENSTRKFSMPPATPRAEQRRASRAISRGPAGCMRGRGTTGKGGRVRSALPTCPSLITGCYAPPKASPPPQIQSSRIRPNKS